MPRLAEWSRIYCSYYYYLPFALAAFLLLQSTYAQGNGKDNGTSTTATCPGVSVAIRALPSDPTYQSPASSIMIGSPVDPSVDYLCSCGSGYDTTGITCYSLKCPPAYDQRSPYGAPYGNRSLNSPYMQPGPYGGGQGQQKISVGPQVGSVETTYPCWKLKKLQVNNYVYLCCFVKGYPSVIYQMTFKPDSQVELTQVETIANNYVTAVARTTYTTENGMTCLVCCFSSHISGYNADSIREPSDLLTACHYNCPNNYRWYFCGNLPITSAKDVSFFTSQKEMHLIATMGVASDSPSASAANLLAGQLPNGASGIARYPIKVDIDKGVCETQGPPEMIVNVGCSTGADSDHKPCLYPLCGVMKTMTVSHAGGNVSMVVAAVNTLLCPLLPGAGPGCPAYSSVACQYDVSANMIKADKCVFLGGADEVSEIQYIRGASDSCQWLIATSPSKQILVYCLSAIAAAINNMTGSCEQNPPVSINPVDIGNEYLFHSAVSCSFKSKCCAGQHTCMTCNRPAKFGEKYLAEMVCTNGGGYKKPNGNGNGNGGGDHQDQDGSSYGGGGGGGMRGGPGGFGMMGPGLYGRPLNYSASNMLPYGPQLPMVGPYGQPGPYNMMPPVGYQPQPVYGARFV